MLKKIFLGLLIASTLLFAQTKAQIEKLIGNMFIVGFEAQKIDANAQIIKDIQKYNLAGVILFNKNITSAIQLKNLTTILHRYSKGNLLIAVDQEGGKVQRLSPKNGFRGYASATTVAGNGKVGQYNIMAKELHSMGINFNLAPVVDLALNPKNRVIVGLKRSFGSDPKNVTKYASHFIKSMNRYNVLTSIKHFPGHGSSLGDTHKGFVDVSKDWKSKELDPYRYLIDSGMVDTIMVAHVYNNKLDPKYPASLSNKTINGLLRGQLGYDGVIISDDLQMRAISQHYSLKNTIKLAINSGMDILLFCNQLNPKQRVSTKKLIDTTYALLQNGEISLAQIKQANQRINQLKSKI
ncbi:MAG: glycoside hydrolase family 3 N-terminal domain-containing protein [Campylobacterota bacterium]|nr:glycoside hydrolase family 3 N-terminal domain-containing protein [Campylobacterota bacterium]